MHTRTIPLIVNAQNLTTTTLTTPITGIAIVEDGFLAYQSGTRVVAVNLSTGQQSEKPIPSHRTAANWAVVSHGIQIGSTLVRLPEIPVMPVRTTPVGYRWLGLSSNNPLMVIPSNWPVVKSPPVGSWTRYVAHNPAMPKEVVTVELSACQGCASPAPLGGPVYAPDAPVLGAAAKTFSWVTDHFVSQKVLKAGWLTTTDTVVWPFGNGNLVVSWTVPVNQKTPFAQSLLVGWRLGSNQIGPIS